MRKAYETLQDEIRSRGKLSEHEDDGRKWAG
jgi:hypothetical protein